MKKTPKDAERILSKVEPEHHFNLHLGTSIKNLHELAEALDIMDLKSFEHHVTKEKNDFANWIRGVIRDNELAEKIAKLKTKKEMAKEVRKRLKELEKAALTPCPKELLGCGTKEFLLGLIVGFIIGLIIKTLVG